MKRGFTLAEVVVVMAILAILGTSGIPYLGRYVARRRLETSGSIVVQDLRRLQMDAVFTRTERKVQFIPGSN